MVDDTRVRARRSRYNSTAKSWGIIHLPTPLSRVFAPAEECRKQTQLGNWGMSEKSQQETHASQQIRGFDRLSDPLDARLGFTKRSCRAKNGLTRLKSYFRTASAKMACAWARVAVRCSAMSLRRLACGDISALRSRARAALTRSSRCASCEGSSRWPSAALGGHLFGRYCPQHLVIRRWVDSAIYCL
jgi:hypothetical protein